MAIVLPGKADTFEVVVSVDDALDMTEEEYEEYAKTLNKDLLKFHPGKEPTVFVMRKVLPFVLAKKVQNEQTSMKDGKLEMQLSFIPEEVRASLVDIKNPSYVSEEAQIKYERHSDGAASEKLIEQLMSAGIVQELYRARQTAIGSFNSSLKKKSQP